jgi:hypothetical protein
MRIILELDTSGVLRLYHDAGQAAMIELRGTDQPQAVASGVLTDLARVRYDLHRREYLLGELEP